MTSPKLELPTDEPTSLAAAAIASREPHVEARPIRAAWLETIIDALSALGPEAGVEATIRGFLDALGDVFPDFALGVWVPGAGRFGGPLVVIGKSPVPTPRAGPPKLFPAGLFEHVILLHDNLSSSLHAAHADEGALAPGSPAVSFFERAARALGPALRRARFAENALAQTAELRQLHEQVIQSEKLASLGQIAAGVVHELNNPLSSIVAYSDYLRRKAERGAIGPDDVERLRRISDAADRILRFSRDLVAYARPSSGVIEIVSLHGIIDQALIFCEHVLAKTGVVVERDFAPRVEPVRGVGGELTQVFVNLFTNACHAMPEVGGRLVVRTWVDGDAFRVSIADNGHGIDERNVAKIFEPFFTTKSDGRGTGLGLSIVRNIVVRHGGTIRVENAPEEGEVVLTLPVARAKA